MGKVAIEFKLNYLFNAGARKDFIALLRVLSLARKNARMDKLLS
jgi:hypothetical protein